MALSGSLDSFALPDVMRLLASTNKTGRLRVSGDRGSGSVWVEDGEIVASELTSPPTTDPTHAEVLFAMLRFSSGSFSFESDSRSVKATSPEQVEPILVSSEHMMVEWRAIEQVVPSLDVYVELAPDPGGGDVMVDAARWRCIAAVGGGSTVGQVGAKLEQGELEICRTVKELVELGLLVIGEAPVELEPEAIAAVAAPEPETIIAATPAPEPALADAPVADIEVPDTASESVVAEETGRVGLDAEIDAENDADDEVVADDAMEPGFDQVADQVADEVADEFADEPEGAEADSVMVDAMTGEVAPADLSNEVEAPLDSGDLLDSSFESGPMVTTTPGLAGLGAPVQSQSEPDDLTDPLIRSGVVDDFGSDPASDPVPDLVPDLVTDGLVAGENGGGSSGGHEGSGLFGGATPAEAEAGPELDPAEMARQLANLSPKAAKAVAAAAKASTEAEREAALAAVEAEDDTVDRGLLLKFLGSVDT